MAKRAHGSAGKQKLSFKLAFAALILMALEWILLVAGMRPHEMIVGALSVAAAALFLYSVHRSSTLSLDFAVADVATCWRIPGYILSRVFQITLILFKDFFSVPAGSFYRVSGFKTAKDDPRLVTRRVLATVYTTAAPNFIIIGIDYEQSRMLFHQIERSGVSEMTKSLGAQP